MAVVRKTAPVGIDFKIDQLQNFLYTNLVATGWTNYESYNRAYRNPREGNFIPEVDKGSGEYSEVFTDDNFSVTSYFLIDENTPIDTEYVAYTGSITFQVKLDQIKASIPHRADEEIVQDVLFWLNKNRYGVRATNIIKGIPNVYTGLKQDQVTFDNMSNRFVFRIDIEFNPISYTCLT